MGNCKLLWVTSRNSDACSGKTFCLPFGVAKPSYPWSTAKSNSTLQHLRGYHSQIKMTAGPSLHGFQILPVSSYPTSLFGPVGKPRRLNLGCSPRPAPQPPSVAHHLLVVVVWPEPTRRILQLRAFRFSAEKPNPRGHATHQQPAHPGWKRPSQCYNMPRPVKAGMHCYGPKFQHY